MEQVIAADEAEEEEAAHHDGESRPEPDIERAVGERGVVAHEGKVKGKEER
jgi:hypothetical protein